MNLEPGQVGADDRGLLLGDGLFETIRLYRGHPFRLEAHLSRLEKGAHRLGLEVPPDLRARIGALLEGGGGWRERDGALRVTLTRGPGWGLLPPQDPNPSLLLALRPWPSGAPPLLEVEAALFGWLDERALTSGIKGTGYLERIQALRESIRVGAEEALLRNSMGRLVEGAAANLFGVREGVLLAPGVRDGALAGITRGILLGLAEELGVEVLERGIDPVELPDLTELFLSSTLREVAAVVRVEGVAIGDGRPGPLTSRLREEFRALVDRERGGGTL